MSVVVGDRITGTTTLVVTDCPTCGCVYAIPDGVYRRGQLRKEGASIYCPNGHSWHYLGKSHADEVAELREAAARAVARRDQAEQDAKMAKAREGRVRKDRDRLKARAAAGVCPCCHRSFQNVARHVATKHPDFREAALP